MALVLALPSAGLAAPAGRDAEVAIGSEGPDTGEIVRQAVADAAEPLADVEPEPSTTPAESPTPSAEPPTAPTPAPEPTSPELTPAPSPAPPDPASSTAPNPSSTGLSATPTPAPTPTPYPTLTPPPRPRTADGPVPSRVLASLGGVWSDRPLPYHDGCHVSMGGRLPSRSCYYGNLSSPVTIALYGDSHALAWFPAVLRYANEKGWRVLNLTMSACIPADIIPYYPSTGTVMTACQAWRKAAIARLARVRPTVIIVAGTRGFSAVDSSGHILTGSARTSAWVAGMKRTLTKLIPLTRRVVLLADIPISRLDNPARCLAAHPGSRLACATSISYAISYSWLNTEYHVALATKVGFVNPERWVCPSSPCPLVIGNYVAYRNKGHLTARFVATLSWKLGGAVEAELARAPTPSPPGPTAPGSSLADCQAFPACRDGGVVRPRRRRRRAPRAR